MSKDYKVKIEFNTDDMKEVFLLKGDDLLCVEGGSDFKSPSSIRTISHLINLSTLKNIKDAEVKSFNENVWTHDPEMGDTCPCNDCAVKPYLKYKS